ncbi:MAG: cell division protein ZapA [Paracoccaceae bacterium]
MGDLDLNVAGRNYRVAVEDGQEAALAEAGALIAAEAEVLRDRFGARFAALPESRVLLLAGLMVADKARAAALPGGATAAEADAGPDAGAEPGEPMQTALFEDPAQAARIAELEARLAEAEAAEAAALAALEDATRRIREMAVELAEEEA